MLGTGKDHTAGMHMDVWTGELWIDGEETIYSPTELASTGRSTGKPARPS